MMGMYPIFKVVKACRKGDIVENGIHKMHQNIKSTKRGKGQ